MRLSFADGLQYNEKAMFRARKPSAQGMASLGFTPRSLAGEDFAWRQRLTGFIQIGETHRTGLQTVPH
jgi:hypothetical protein